MPIPEPSQAAAGPGGEEARQLCAMWLALRQQHLVNEGLRHRLAAMEASQSWRITAPLRRLRSWLARRTPHAASPLPPGARVPPADPFVRVAALPNASELLRLRVGFAPARTREAEWRRQLFVDVTELAQEDLGAGVQRVVNRLLAELLLEAPGGFRVEPVRLSADGEYVYARAFLARLLGLAPEEAGKDRPIAAAAGDVFFGLDLIRDRAELAAPALRTLRNHRVRVIFVVYDLLPKMHPEWFPEGMGSRFERWLNLLFENADCALCISETVGRELRALLAGRVRPDRAPMQFANFPLGADLGDWITPRAWLPAMPAGSARFLLVGTIEPRKGHEQALAAFERLWAAGSDLQLVIAGRPGWRLDAFIARLRTHPEAGRRLHWIEGGDDSELDAAYRASSVLLVPSSGEGFGLPLVEAASRGLPILARDLPVFREVAGAGADYFSGDGVDDLVAAIEHWLELRRSGAHADPAVVVRHSWRESADCIRNMLAGAADATP